jgi:hypothetical protein
VYEPGLGDRIATWVTAGDDVVLAEYGMVNGETRQGGESLRTVLDSWARGLSEVDELDEGMFLSFGAGLSLREVDEPEVKIRQIQEMMEIAGWCEESSKLRWKSMVDSECSDEDHPMLMRRSGRGSDKVEWESEEGWEGSTSFIENTRSVLVKEGGEAHSETEEKEDGRFPGFEEWTESLIEEILEQKSLPNLDDKEKWELLSRHYFEKTGDELTLVVLPMKEK